MEKIIKDYNCINVVKLSNQTSIPNPIDMLIIDNWVAGGDLKDSLDKYHSLVTQFIVINNTSANEIFSTLYYSKGDLAKYMRKTGYTLRQSQFGSSLALQEFFTSNSEWEIYRKYTTGKGITILKRISFDKPVKVIVYVITSQGDVYKDLEDMWRKYMDLNARIKCFFIRGDPNLEQEWQISSDGKTIYCRCQENLVPGIIEKSMISLNYLKTDDTYDYVIRTNISSFWIWDRLLDYLQVAPRHKFYAGRGTEPDFHKHMQGTNIILSRDLAHLLYENREIVTKLPYPDDVIYWVYLVDRLGIQPVNDYGICEYIDYIFPSPERIKYEVVDNKEIHQVRVKTNDRKVTDLYIHKKLIKYIYGIE